MTQKRIPLWERFPSKFAVDERTGCWEWQAARRGGYGVISDLGRQYSAHRVAYELYVGPIPAGLQLDHLCRNHGCVNPEHLEPVTPRENMARGIHPGAYLARENRCLEGHDMTDPGNVYIRTDGGGGRRCRECKRLRWLRLYSPRASA